MDTLLSLFLKPRVTTTYFWRINAWQGTAVKFLLLVFLFVPTTQASAQTNDTDDDYYQLLESFGEVFENIEKYYVDVVDKRELIEAAIAGMLQDLDPHSAYFNPEAYQDLQVETKGEFGGLGIEVTLDESGAIRVVSPIDDTPASKAGIQAGDLIVRIDTQPINGLSLSEAVHLMRGKVGTDIVLTIARDTEELFDVTITRDIIAIRSVRSNTERDDIGYIRISSFTQNTASDTINAINTLSDEKETEPKGYILDLRNNPGGLLDQSVHVSDIFLERGEIVSTRGGQSRNDVRRFQATKGDKTNGKPLIVLINAGSASASEIVAGALQDHQRAIVVGTKSFGKGSVQTILPLSNNQGGIKLTTQRYYTPSGKSIQGEGITPDIIVEPSRVEVLKRVRNVYEADLRGSLDSKDSKSDDIDKTTEDNQSDDQPIDYQLDQSINILHALILQHIATQ